MYKFGFIGMGNMASAIQEGFIKKGAVQSEDICGCDLSEAAQKRAIERGVAVFDDAKEVINQSEMIFIAVKPQVVEKVIESKGALY